MSPLLDHNLIHLNLVPVFAACFLKIQSYFIKEVCIILENAVMILVICNFANLIWLEFYLHTKIHSPKPITTGITLHSVSNYF